MLINAVDPVIQTALFASFFITTIVLSSKKDPSPHEMNHSHTNELKGIAILMIIFGHIGYFLFDDHRFLYPLSVASGIGVNLFLFLSGFGLTISAIKKEWSIFKFYAKRLKTIFIPMWVVLISILILDAALLNRAYNFSTIIQSFFGFFPVADIDISINSPLWYFSLIIFYYLIFPIVYMRKKPLISIGLVLLISIMMMNLNLPVSKDVLKLYKLHYLAFPLGMGYAFLFDNVLSTKLIKYLRAIPIMRIVLIVLLSILFGYTAVHSGIGESIMLEQFISLVAMLAVILIVVLKTIKSDLLVVFGVYSYEIYLIHWPLIHRYDFIYQYTPPFLGTLLYMIIFIVLGFILNRLVKIFNV